ncbi:MAG: RNA polymerase sigma factor [Thermoguttaceae bacterium]|nr:RNA polymerase sigma factor [Thermoguttaceae bacterium]
MNAALAAAPRANEFADFTDEELLIEYRVFANRRCFDELYRRHQADLTRYLFRRVGSREVAEDAVQATFMRVLQKHGQFDAEKKFRPWLYRIAHNQAIDLKRRSKRHDEAVSLDASSVEGDFAASWSETLPSREPDPFSTTENAEAAQSVRNAIAQLPEGLRQILDLIYFQGMRYYEAAENLQLPTATLKSRLNSALRQLNSFFARQRTDFAFARLNFELDCPQA